MQRTSSPWTWLTPTLTSFPTLDLFWSEDLRSNGSAASSISVQSCEFSLFICIVKILVGLETTYLDCNWIFFIAELICFRLPA